MLLQVGSSGSSLGINKQMARMLRSAPVTDKALTKTIEGWCILEAEMGCLC